MSRVSHSLRVALFLFTFVGGQLSSTVAAADRICVSPQARGKGTVIALNNQVNAAREATKTHTSDVETFKSADLELLRVEIQALFDQ